MEEQMNIIYCGRIGTPHKIKYYAAEDESKMKKAELKRHKTGKWECQSIASRLKQALKKAEHERLWYKESPASPPPRLDKVNTVVLPLSAKMQEQEWMPIQWEIYNKPKKGQVHESPEEA